MNFRKTISILIFIIFSTIVYINLVGFSNGITGLTKKGGNTIGCFCHGPEPDTTVSVIITGPSQVFNNDTAIYTLRISGGRNIAAGCDIAVNLGSLSTSVLDTSLQLDFIELTHRYPKLFTSDTLEFIFKYTAPSTPGVFDTLFANGNSVNLNGSPTGDVWNFAENFPIEILDRSLPVELVSFTASANGSNVRLAWTTVSEQNNAGFEVQRSINNAEWSNAGFVHGNGTVSTPSNYYFEDRNLSSGDYRYRLKQIDFNGNYSYFDLQNEVVIGIPDKFSLEQNYPNPFNPRTVIRYHLPVSGFVSLKIYNALGNEVAQLVSENQIAGFYSVDFDASENERMLASGMYFYTLKSVGLAETKSMMLIK